MREIYEISCRRIRIKNRSAASWSIYYGHIHVSIKINASKIEKKRESTISKKFLVFSREKSEFSILFHGLIAM